VQISIDSSGVQCHSHGFAQSAADPNLLAAINQIKAVDKKGPGVCVLNCGTAGLNT
jgi:hypothetical protein